LEIFGGILIFFAEQKGEVIRSGNRFGPITKHDGYVQLLFVLDPWVMWSGLVVVMVIRFGSSNYHTRLEHDMLTGLTIVI